MAQPVATERAAAAAVTEPPGRFGRVVLKLSGENFGGGAIGVDPDVVQSIAQQIATVVRRGVQVAVVVGGGNFFRGEELQQRGMDRPRADYMGILGTVMNSLALQDFLERQGIDTRVQTAITMAQIAEPYIPRRAIRHLEKGRVVIFGGGAGMPYFSTDTVAARKLDTVTFAEALRQRLQVVDAAAFSLCMDNGLPMLVFGAEGADSIVRAVSGDQRTGTLLTAT
jgi:uridylate kinase